VPPLGTPTRTGFAVSRFRLPPDWRLRTSGLFRSAALRMQLSCLTPADGRSRSVRRPACRSSRASAEARSAGMLCSVRHRPRIMVRGGGRLSLRNTPSGSILAATGLLRPPCCGMRSAYPGNGCSSNVSGYSLRHSPRLASNEEIYASLLSRPWSDPKSLPGSVAAIGCRSHGRERLVATDHTGLFEMQLLGFRFGLNTRACCSRSTT
jgi:hypothetical protein